MQRGHHQCTHPPTWPRPRGPGWPQLKSPKPGDPRGRLHNALAPAATKVVNARVLHHCSVLPAGVQLRLSPPFRSPGAGQPARRLPCRGRLVTPASLLFKQFVESARLMHDGNAVRAQPRVPAVHPDRPSGSVLARVCAHSKQRTGLAAKRVAWGRQGITPLMW